MKSKIPYAFDEFFASGQEDALSPFIMKSPVFLHARLTLKRSLIALASLSIALILRNIDPATSAIFLVFTYFLAGTPALIDTVHDVLKFEINIDVLMTLAALLSIVIGSALEGGLLLVLFAISGALEEMVESKTKAAITHLHDLTPKIASLIQEDGTVHTRSIRDIRLGDYLLVRVGDIVPLDGIIVDGATSVNMAHLTGESLPIHKTANDHVTAGSVNLEGALKIKVTSTFANSTLTKMTEMIMAAGKNRPQLQRFIDRFGTLYAKIIISLFALFALGLPWLFGLSYFGPEGSIYRALAFLIAASPCALVIATPTAYLSAISSLARKGILLKGGSILDAVATCQATAFDKTGTLTEGELTLTEMTYLQGDQIPESTILAIALALSHQAMHPIGRAIEKKAKALNISPVNLIQAQVHPGRGITGSLTSGALCALGNQELIESLQKDLPFVHNPGTSTFLLLGDQLIQFSFQDSLKPHLLKALANLKKQGVKKMAILSGDQKSVIAQVAQAVGIEDARGELSPQDKLAAVTTLSSQYGLMMVGDGINDAPALARATVGISMGQMGSSTAVSASHVVLVHDDLLQLALLKKKAHQTRRIVKQNVILALLVILLATTPALLGEIPLWLAVILHEGGTVLVGINSLRLLRN